MREIRKFSAVQRSQLVARPSSKSSSSCNYPTISEGDTGGDGGVELENGMGELAAAWKWFDKLVRHRHKCNDESVAVACMLRSSF